MKLDFAKAVPELRTSECAVLSVQETARVFGISSEHVIGLIEAGTLSAIDLSSKGASRRSWRLPIGDLLKFAEERSSDSPQCPATPTNKQGDGAK